MSFYRLKGQFPQIGNSKYYFNVWYKVTNPECLYQPKPTDEFVKNPFSSMDNFVKAASVAVREPEENRPIGFYARQSFTAVKLFFEGNKYEYINDEHDSEIEWECRMFLDTLDCGSERIASGYNKQEVFDKVIKMLDEAKVVLDIDNTQEAIKSFLKDAKQATENADFLNNLIIAENPKHFENTKNFKRKN